MSTQNTKEMVSNTFKACVCVHINLTIPATAMAHEAKET